MTVHYPAHVTFTTRLSGEEAEAIRRAAELHGTTRSNFIREAATTHAADILKDPEAFVLARIRRLTKRWERIRKVGQ
jgi:uncharacterized protein (DUF1778 family)|tara:strand:- start:345 stop:575 length:231 start_codon:yes stop_codon:yes gene_type:complete